MGQAESLLGPMAGPHTWAWLCHGLSQHGTHTLKGPVAGKSTLTWPSLGGCQNNLQILVEPCLTLAWHCPTEG